MAERCDNSRSLPKKKRARHGFRYQMELNFDTEDAKQAFVARIDRAKLEAHCPCIAERLFCLVGQVGALSGECV